MSNRNGVPPRRKGKVRFANQNDRIPGEVITYKLSEAELAEVRKGQVIRTKEEFKQLLEIGHSEISIMDMWGWSYLQLTTFKKKNGIRTRHSSTR